MRVRFYGRLADSIAREIDFDAPAQCTVSELRTSLDRAFPDAGLSDSRVRACVAGAIVPNDHPLSADQLVEMLAPVSGG